MHITNSLQSTLTSMIRCHVLTQELASLLQSPEGVAVDSDVPVLVHCIILIETHFGNMGATEHHAGDVAVV